MKPYIFCHMMTSVDGRIDCPMVGQLGIDGRRGETAVFDGIVKSDCTPYHLKLQSVEQWESNIVWRCYKTVK